MIWSDSMNAQFPPRRRRAALVLLSLLMASLTPHAARAQDGQAIPDITEDQVRELQAALLFLGHEIEGVTGFYGEQTTRAVEAFEFSVGMGNEGRLDAGERALLDAQIVALSYEKFGYRLRGYWSPVPCDQDTTYDQGIWLDDLAIFDGDTPIPLIEQTLPEPLLLNVEGVTISLTSPYLTPYGGEPDLRLFPIQGKMVALVQDQAQTISACQSDLSHKP